MPDDGKRSRILDGAVDLRRPFGEDRGDGSGEETAVEEAYRRGLDEGRQDGERLAGEEYGRRLESFHDEMSAALRRIGELHETLTSEHKELMIELALAAAARMLREKIDADDPVASRALNEALQALPEGGTIQARLHPDDVAAVERDLAQLIERRRVELQGDEQLSRGGCVVKSDPGLIDARIETAEQEIREAAKGRVGE